MSPPLAHTTLMRLRAAMARWSDEGDAVAEAALRLNLKHIHAAAGVLAVLNAVHVAVFGWVLEHADPVRSSWAQHVTWAHAAMAVLMVGVVVLVRTWGPSDPIPRYARLLPEVMSAAVLGWAVALTVVDQAVTTNISPYMNACASVAIVLMLQPLRALVLLLGASALLTWCLGLVTADPATLLSNRVNAAAASVMALMVSVLLWRRYTQTELLQRALADTNRVLKHQREELETLATRDPLTHLLNRREWLQQAEHALARAQHDRTPLSLLMLDLDHFKAVNDSFGHPAGDAVLRHTAQLMTHSVRQTDKVARFGGEEFVVLLPNTDADSAQVLAEKLRLNIANTPTPQSGAVQAIPMTTSIGLVCLPAGQALSLDQLLAQSDQALYQAKSQGRNRVNRSPLNQGIQDAPGPPGIAAVNN